MKFIKNTSTSKLVLVGGQLEIDIGGTAEVSDNMANLEELLTAQRKGWISISSKGKTEAGGEPAAYTFTKDEMAGTTEYPKSESKTTKKAKVVEQASTTA